MKGILAKVLTFAAVLGAAFPSVASASVVPNDPFFSEQWYLGQIGAPEAWETTTGDASVIVAVIDTGVDIYNPDLKDNIWSNPGEITGNKKDDDGNGFIDDLYGWNFVNYTNDVRPWGDATDADAYVHGTLVSSIIAGKGNNGIGVAGIAWNAKIMPLVALANDGTGSTTDVARAVRYAVDNGASVINLSIEGETRDPDLDDAIAYGRMNGVLTVTVAGNADPGIDLGATPIYPACAAEGGMYGTLTVSATDEDDRKADFANYGSCVDVMAPGVEIFGARPRKSGDDFYEGGYAGTSVAAPVVSGVAALLKSIHPSWGATELRERIRATAAFIGEKNAADLQGKLGAGRVDAAAAVSNAAGRVATGTALRLEGSLPANPSRFRILTDLEVIAVAPFGESDTRGAVAAFADFDADGTPEIIAVPASGEGGEAVVYGRDGQERKRLILPNGFRDGALVVGTADGAVIADPLTGQAWGIDRQFTVRPFYPYGTSYANGLDLLAISGAAAFAPRNGGGRLVVTDANGTQLVSAFPFGTAPSGRWSLARATDGSVTSLLFSGPLGTKSINGAAIGQTGWTDVAFTDLERMTLTLSGGTPGELAETRTYDLWPSR